MNKKLAQTISIVCCTLSGVLFEIAYTEEPRGVMPHAAKKKKKNKKKNYTRTYKNNDVIDFQEYRKEHTK